MSAFICSDAHFNFIVNFANTAFPQYKSLPGGSRLDNPQELGEILYKANVASVDYRYPHHVSAGNAAPGWKWQPKIEAATLENLVKFLKALDCLAYQSCERNDWEESQAYKAIQAMRGMAIAALPGYDAAPWGIDN